MTDDISVLLLTTPPATQGGPSIGLKRQTMLESATSPWISFIDDDDLIPADYCRQLGGLLTDDCDVIGFRLGYFVDGFRAGEAIHSYRAAEIPTPNLGLLTRFDREPNHLNPTRRALALKAGYRDMRTGEDADYSRRLAGLKPREAFVDAICYEYWYRTKKTESVE